MRKQSKSALRSGLRLSIILTIVGLLFFISSFDHPTFRHSEVQAQNYNQKNKVVLSDFSEPLSNDFGLQPLEANTEIDNAGFDRTAPGEITFKFSGFGNPQRPFPGYQGRFQLGPVDISGDGVIRAKDGKLMEGGSIDHIDDLVAGKYRYHETRWQVVRGLGINSKSGVTTLKLLVKVTISNFPSICPVGTQGVITLTDDNRRMNNKQTRDSIKTQMPNPFSIAADGGAACRTHVHGMNNISYSWTDPPRGGPGGGNRANVNIKVEAQNVGICNISGSWRQSTRGVSNSTWTFTLQKDNRYQATERGSGNARGTAVLTGNQLRLDASTGNLSGFYLWTINRNCNAGNGKLVFTRGRQSTHTSTITRLPGGGGGGGGGSGNPVGRYRRYANTGINASFDVNYFFRNFTVKQCSTECNKYSWCKGFEYIPSRQHCYLHRTSARKGKTGVVAYIKR